MEDPEFLHPRPGASVSRRNVIRSSALGAAAIASSVGTSTVNAAPIKKPDDRRASPKPYQKMKKSINQWAFPYPDRMNLKECLQLAKDAGFDGIELNYDLENDLSPKSGTAEYTKIRKMADEIGIAISGLCSFLFWPYPLTSNDENKRTKGIELAGKMTRAAHDLGVENLLVVPGAVHIPWRDDHDPVANDICDQRAKAAVENLLPMAEKLNVSMNIENIFFNGYLMTPMEMNAFVDHFSSEWLKVHFDTGNIMEYQFPEHWARILGDRTKNIHLKEYTKKGTDHSLECFRPLLDGTTDWPEVIKQLDEVNYEGYLTFEYFHPYQHYPEALIYQTSDSLDRILGRS